MVNEDKIKEMNQFIEDFCVIFENKFKILPTVYYSKRAFREAFVNLDKIEYIANTLLREKVSYPEIKCLTIKTKRRRKEIIQHRDVTIKILHDLGYSPTHIAKIFNMSHSSMIYAVKKVESFLEIKDTIYTQLLNKFEYELKKQTESIDNL